MMSLLCISGTGNTINHYCYFQCFRAYSKRLCLDYQGVNHCTKVCHVCHVRVVKTTSKLPVKGLSHVMQMPRTHREFPRLVAGTSPKASHDLRCHGIVLIYLDATH